MAIDSAALLREHPIDPSIVEGARNAVRTCLGLEAGQRFVLIVESGHEGLGAGFLAAADAVGAGSEVIVVDARRAASPTFLESTAALLATADASLFVGSIDGIPASFRHHVIDAGGARRRHGHMPGLNVAMMQQSMRTDYEEVRALTARLAERVAGEVTVSVRAPRGTDLTIRCDSSSRWCREDGVLREPGWTNLPAGELLTTPSSAEGVLVPDGGVWDAQAQPVRNADRLRILFSAGAVTTIEGGSGSDPDALLAQLDATPNLRRLGQVALGTNVGVVAAIGNVLQDLKMPGFHVSLGHTRPEHTGASWSCPIEIPLLVRRADVDVDGTPVLRNGRFVAPWV